MNYLYASPSVQLGSFVLWVCVAVLVFLVLREVFTWYWKINKIVDLLEKIEKNTRQGKDAAQSSVVPNKPEPPAQQ